MKKIILILALIVSNNPTFAQGCSDAGICSIGSGFQHSKKQFKNNLEIATIFAAGEADVTYISPFVAYTRQFNDKFALSTKVSFSSAKGNFGRRADFGDAYLIGNYAFKEAKNKQWSAVLGMKFPLSKSNDKINDYAIPLDYQASLGSFDLFLGTNFKYHIWNFSGTIQIPVFNINKNSYIKEFSGTNDFPTTNLFIRKSDVLFKSSYNFKPKNIKFSFQPNLLFIYHLGEDSYENIYGKRQNISGSEGLTINGNLISTYKMNNKNSIELSLASPFVVRDVRPDGLTRKYVISINYKYNF